MTILTATSKTATPGAVSQTISQRLKALSVRPHSLTVSALIDRYMAQYAGRDPTRLQRLSTWQTLIGDFTLEQVDSDLIHVCRTELQTEPPLVFVGLDHLGHQIFKVKGRAHVKSTATLNRYMVAISAVFTWSIEQRLTPKGWVHPCRGIKRLPESDGRVRFLDAAERTRLFEAVRASQYPRLHAMTLMAMKTGARRGELLGLTWRDIDLKTGIARLGRTKNGDRRTLVLLPDVIEALTPFKSSDLDRYVFGSVRSKYQVPKRLQELTVGLVVLVHHTGKDTTKGLRGHSSLFAAMDAAIEVSNDGARRRWSVAKSKDAQDGDARTFKLAVVEMGTDEFGDLITSCVVTSDTSAEEIRQVRLPQGGNQKIVLEALRPFFRSGHGAGS
ncbi:MAG: tyrosine-type recombinase/integrase [Aquabacterium sp.]|nr:tyrosine-type recombinase/integrase [Aquabacterium sp.]